MVRRLPLLPAANRMRRPADFTATVRGGRRCRRGVVTLHFRTSPDPARDATGDPPRVGLVVGKGVGGSVVRHQVSRRLRAQMAQRLPLLPAGSLLVIRAAAPAAEAGSAQLGADLDAALRVLLRAGRPGAAPVGR